MTAAVRPLVPPPSTDRILNFFSSYSSVINFFELATQWQSTLSNPGVPEHSSN